MKLKRLAATLNATFEDFVSRVENHEAVAEHVLEQVRSAAARLKVELARVEAQQSHMQERRGALTAERDRWRERALRLAGTDEARALECVSRLEACEAALAALEREYSEHGRLADGIRRHLRDVEQKLHELQLRKTSLSTREARAEAVRTLDEQGTSHEIVRVFDRWEVRVASDEYRQGAAVSAIDPLDRELGAAESEDALRRRLASLVADAHHDAAGGTS